MDVGAFNNHTSKNYKMYGSSNFTPLDYDRTSKHMLNKFIKLHDASAYHVEDFVPTGVLAAQIAKHTNKIINTRSRALFVNKFTRHGLKARAMKAYATSLGKFHTDDLNKVNIPDFLNSYSYKRLLYGFGYCISIGGERRVPLTYKFARVEKRAKYGLYLNNSFDWESTEAVFNMMARWAPIRALVINKVSKQVYKFTRGKSGRYTASIKHIGPNLKFSYMQRSFKMSYRFSQRASFRMRLYEVLYGAVVEPKTTLGFVSRRLAGDRVLR